MDLDTQTAGADGAARPLIAVVIVNYRTPGFTIEALQSVAADRSVAADVVAVVIDNASGDDSPAMIDAAISGPLFAGWTSFLPQTINGGFGWGNNQGLLHLAARDRRPDHVLFLNPDAKLCDGTMTCLLSVLERQPECGVVGASLLGADGVPGNFAFRAPGVGREFVRGGGLSRIGKMFGIAPTQIEDTDEADWVTGAAFLARWQALEQGGLFDDGYFLYFEEIELMARIRAAGWTIRYARDAHVWHIEGSATGVDWQRALLPPYWHRSRRRYFVQALGEAGADRADRAYRWGRTVARWRGRGSVDDRENLQRMAAAAALPLAPQGVARFGDPIGRPPAWMDIS